ncbi:NACHT, LRR and PYD domains-containing protein 3 isoform X2 [Misgurnus anguillicaudatus]|uniref:NACHT, LRR and PYD domains-containing protein 3 isoform X2 n=1 Tax=Misgurnus anguillicaudatus TaxID=75329 RepID=UPI003CCF90FB
MSETEKQSDRSGSCVSSSVSIKSDHSKGDLPNFSEDKPTATKRDRPGSPVFSSVSIKSDHSKGDLPNFSEETPTATKSNQRPVTSVNIGSEINRWKALKEQRGIKSDEELATFLINRLQYETSEADIQNCEDDLPWIFKDLEYEINTFQKKELERFQKILRNEMLQDLVKDYKDRNQIREAFLDITLHFLRCLKQDEHADKLEDELVYICQLKSNLEKRYQRVFEGITNHGDSTLLNKIYTDLYITQGGGQQINTEHEIRQIEVTSRNLETSETQIEFNNMFNPLEQDQNIRIVLTKGVAGIGKSVSVQKFVLDWAEGKENKDISFIFPLPFREMNLKDKERVSLMDLISQFFPEVKGLNLTRNNKKVLFIFDGLDECRLPLKFDSNEMLCDVTSPASLDVLLTNLIKGNLFPSALIWITTRPAAAGKIPPECIDRVTEVRGFNDAQKVEYFRKRFTDENMANTIIDHVKKSKSLFIMCHIPVFCWISATVLQNILEKKRNDQSDDTTTTSEDTPKTLTQMYTHFFRFQIQQSRRKYEGEYSPDICWDKDSILSLGKLAFQQLEGSNLIFYDTDLEVCGIDITKASVYSGMCTQIFKQETGIITGSVYCFVHLSIQEFTAALYAHLLLDISKKNVFAQDHTGQENNETMMGLLKTAVDKALESENGHLDLFLRFLLGLTLKSNRPLLRGLLTQEESNEQSNKEIVEYIKQKFEDNSSAERSINLFFCLNELNDQSLVKEIQKHLRKGSLSSADLSPAQWSALVFVLLTSEKDLEVFELQKFKKSDECLIRLSPVIKTAKRALLNDCNLTEKSCSALANVLGSDSNVKELNVSNNILKDSGVKLLCDGLKNTTCELEILNLSDCSIGEEGYVALYSAVRSNPSHLIELDLSGNDPGESGVKLIHDLIQDPKCALKKVRLLKNRAAEEACVYLNEVLDVDPLLLKELNLSDNKLGDLDGKKLSALLMDSHSKVKKIILNDCELTEKQCSAVAALLFCVKEIEMNNSRLMDSGVKQICDELKKRQCQLQILKLSKCSIGEEGYVALCSAVRSNPSHLIELDLSGNDPGESGVKLIYDLIQDQNCALKTVRLLKSSSAVEVFKYLSETLDINPLLQRELNLSDHKLDNTRVKQICDLLKDKHCRLNTLRFSGCHITQEYSNVLISALSSVGSHLRDLDLSDNKLSYDGIKQLGALLKNSDCKLQKLRLRACGLTHEGCSVLTSALNSNPSHLRELDLSENKLELSGVENLCDLLKNAQFKLETLKLCCCSITEKQCVQLISALSSNPSHLRELNISENEIRESGVKKLSDLLRNTHCRLEKLKLRACDLTRGCFSALTSALNSHSLYLRELNLSENELELSIVENLCDLLRNSQFKLETLKLCGCSITETMCDKLISALCLNPSHLRELNLSENTLTDLGVKHVCNLLKHLDCKMEKLELKACGLTDVGCFAFTSVMNSNPSHLTQLNLSENKIMDDGVKHLCDLLNHSHCRLVKLNLSNCNITDVSSLAEARAVRSFNILDLRNNDIKPSSEKKLRDVLQNSSCNLRLGNVSMWSWIKFWDRRSTRKPENPKSQDEDPQFYNPGQEGTEVS